MVEKGKSEKEGEVIKIEPLGIQVIVPPHMRGGAYSNLANVTVTKGGEVILDFINANPHDNPPGTLVGRIILTASHARRLSETLKGILDKTLQQKK